MVSKQSNIKYEFVLQVLTRDSVTVAVDAVVYYRIKEPLNAVVRVADYR